MSSESEIMETVGCETVEPWFEFYAIIIQVAEGRPDLEHALARVAFSFDPDRREDLPWLLHVRDGLGKLSSSVQPGTSELTFAKVLAEDYLEGQFRRWPLPNSLTEDVPAFMAEILLPFRDLPAGFSFTERYHHFLRCRAQAGNTGPIELVALRIVDVAELHEQMVIGVSRRGRQITAVAVEILPLLREGSPHDETCTVLITFDQSIPKPAEKLEELAEIMRGWKESPPLDHVEYSVVELLRTVDLRPDCRRRRQLPLEFTGGTMIFLTSLWVHREYLTDQRLESRRLLCVAEPGLTGALELLPHQNVTRGQHPRQVLRAAAKRAGTMRPRMGWRKRFMILAVGLLLMLSAFLLGWKLTGHTITSLWRAFVPAGIGSDDDISELEELNERELKQLLTELRGTDPVKRARVAGRLCWVRPGGLRREIAAALSDLLADEDPGTSRTSVQALARWGTVESITPVAAYLTQNTKQITNQVAAMHTLSKIQDPQSAEVLAECLQDFNLAGTASKSLIKLGPIAEAAVHKCLNNQQPHVRFEACRILKKIGTTKSLAGLELLIDDDRKQVADAAREAIVEIRTRR